jgi:glycerol uptake facilitator-like aquaporin
MNLIKYIVQRFNKLPAKFIMEFLGSMIFHFIGSVSPTPLSNSIILMVLIYFTAKISGGHLNPAVSWTFMLLGHINPFEMIIYWIAQISGCITGALWIACLVPEIYIRNSTNHYSILYDGCFIPNNTLSNARIFGWEALCTFNFILPIFAVVWYTQVKSGYGNTGPIIVGLSLFANALACGSWTGAALNPARVLGSPVVFNCENNKTLFYYIIGEITGATAAVLAIIPWYGIAQEAWYIDNISKKITNKLIVFTSNNNVGMSKILKACNNNNEDITQL